MFCFSNGKELELKPFKQVQESSRDPDVRGMKETICNDLNHRCSHAGVKKIIFTELKDFSVEIITDHHGDRVYRRRKLGS